MGFLGLKQVNKYFSLDNRNWNLSFLQKDLLHCSTMFCSLIYECLGDSVSLDLRENH